MLVQTKAIVLRTVKYGDTSLIATLYTEAKGIQSFIVKGALKASKKGNSLAPYYTIGSLIQISYNAAANKSLYMAIDVQFYFLNHNTNVVKNAIIVFALELVNNTLQEPETNFELYTFLESCVQYICNNSIAQLSWMPVWFTWHYAAQLGFKLSTFKNEYNAYLHLTDGLFIPKPIAFDGYTLGLEPSKIIFDIAITPLHNIASLNLDNGYKRQLLQNGVFYLQLHIPYMSKIKSLSVMQSVFE